MGGRAEGLRTYVCESNSELLDIQGMPGDKGDKGDAGLPGPQVLFLLLVFCQGQKPSASYISFDLDRGVRS